jgi:hypothetical protein
MTTALTARLPLGFEFIEQLVEVLATHAAEGRMEQGRAGPFLVHA